MERQVWVKYVFLGGIGVLIILAGVLYLSNQHEEEVSLGTLVEKNQTEQTAVSTIYVDLCGEVITPQVYAVAKGSRLFEVVEQAGGMTSQAAREMVNLAREVQDGEQIYIPNKKELQEDKQLDSTRKISINRGTEEELMRLTGVGQVKARAILTYRKEKGQFIKLEDLMQVEGIKEGMFNKIKEEIRL